eukprot:5809542-Prymnesium_polylepis.1
MPHTPLNTRTECLTRHIQAHSPAKAKRARAVARSVFRFRHTVQPHHHLDTTTRPDTPPALHPPPPRRARLTTVGRAPPASPR